MISYLRNINKVALEQVAKSRNISSLSLCMCVGWRRWDIHPLKRSNNKTAAFSITWAGITFIWESSWSEWTTFCSLRQKCTFLEMCPSSMEKVTSWLLNIQMSKKYHCTYNYYQTMWIKAYLPTKGSPSDALFQLKLLSRHWEIMCSKSQLADISSQSQLYIHVYGYTLPHM